jgi:hypothetical protein
VGVDILRQAEIGQIGDRCRVWVRTGLDQDVSRLDVTMDQSNSMCGIESVALEIASSCES